MKKIFIVSLVMALVGIVIGAYLFSQIGTTTITEVVERTVPTLGNVGQVIKKYPDIEEMVMDEARKREIRQEIIKLNEKEDSLTRELVELESKGFTQESTTEQN